MKLQLSKFALLLVVLFLTACSSLSESGIATAEKKMLVALPIATAVQIDYQDEVKLLHLSQLITEHKGSKKEKALLFYERGLIYDRMGLTTYSRYDFTQAINTYPAFADPYVSYGVYLLLAQSYDEAFDAFDSAIELSDKLEFSYLHRAVGLYQVKRYSLASRDINTFYELDKNDPYRILWRYLIDSTIDEPKALRALQSEQAINDEHPDIWAVIDLIAGRISESEFFLKITIGAKSNKELAARLCESYFYLGHWHKLSGNLEKAIYYFKMSTSTNMHQFIEYKYALMELASIQKELQQQLQDKLSVGAR